MDVFQRLLSKFSMATLIPLVLGGLLILFASFTFLLSILQLMDFGQRMQGTSLEQSAYQAAVQVADELQRLEWDIYSTGRRANEYMDLREPERSELLRSAIDRSIPIRRIVIKDNLGNTVVDISRSDGPDPAGNRFIPPPGPVTGQYNVISLSRDMGSPVLRPPSGLPHPGWVMHFYLSWDWISPVLDRYLVILREQMQVTPLVVRTKDRMVLWGPPSMVHETLGSQYSTGTAGVPHGWFKSDMGAKGKYLVGFAGITPIPDMPSLDLTILVAQSRELADIPLRGMAMAFLAGTLLLGLCFLPLTLVVARRISGPLVELADSARAWNPADMPRIAKIHAPKELRDLSLAMRIMASTILRASRARREAERMAAHDHLTGLPNRHALARLLEDTVMWEGRFTMQIFIYIDLDGFKAINDKYGHEAGDEVLRTVSRRMLDSGRGDTVCIRLGGDEFLVILRLSSRELGQDTIAPGPLADWRPPPSTPVRYPSWPDCRQHAAPRFPGARTTRKSHCRYLPAWGVPSGLWTMQILQR